MFRWETYSYRHYDETAEEAFKPWIVMHDWREVIEQEGSNNKTNAYQATLQWAVDQFFPLKTTRKKSTDLPWLDKKTLKLIRNRRRLFWTEGGERTDRWKAERTRVDKIIRDRKRGYMDRQRMHILAEDVGRNFFKHVKNFATFEKPAVFDVRTLLPGQSDSRAVERL